MKTNFFAFLFLLTSFSVITATTIHYDANVEIAQQNLPISVKNFIKKYFPNATIIKSEAKRIVTDRKKYEVKLNNGVEIDFNKAGNWLKIDAPNGVPNAFIPAKIKSYVARNYKGVKVKSIEKERNKIKVDLMNDIDLVFNTNGDFVRVD